MLLFYMLIPYISYYIPYIASHRFNAQKDVVTQPADNERAYEAHCNASPLQ